MTTATPNSATDFRRSQVNVSSVFFSGLTGLATLIIMALLVIILGNIFYHGWAGFSWGFITRGTEKDMFDVKNAGVFPMLFGTAARVIIMTIFVIPIGVITAIYLTEYAQSGSLVVRVIRGAINNLAGVPSIVFGLFGLGFFIEFVGKGMDTLLRNPHAVWGKPALIWASLTLAVMTLPVVIVATEEALKAIAPGLREASLALGATKLQTVVRVVLPQAMP